MTETKKTNGKAGDEVRASVLRLTEEAKKASIACRETADMIDQAIEELNKAATEKYELVAASIEDHIDRSNSAIDTVRGLIDMIKETGQPQRALPPPVEADAFKAVEAAILKSKKQP